MFLIFTDSVARNMCGHGAMIVEHRRAALLLSSFFWCPEGLTAAVSSSRGNHAPQKAGGWETARSACSACNVFRPCCKTPLHDMVPVPMLLPAVARCPLLLLLLRGAFSLGVHNALTMYNIQMHTAVRVAVVVLLLHIAVQNAHDK